MKNFKRALDKDGFTIDLLNEILAAYKEDMDRMKTAYERYKAAEEAVAILNRTEQFTGVYDSANVKRIDNKVNNRLNNPYDADIVDTKVGYMFGHPITYELDMDKENPSTTDVFLKDELERFLLRNNVEDLDSESGKLAAICGRASRLVYIDLDGKESIRNIDPWEVVHIGDDISHPEYSIWKYYDGEDEVIEAYSRESIMVYRNGEFEMSRINVFEYTPLFGIANNRELQGDAEKVMNLIDAYDRTLSDASNEIEQWRLAYLVLTGGSMGDADEFMEEVKKTGVFELMDEKDSVKYLTKDVNDQMIENHLNRLDENIIRFAKSVNFGDESFGTNITGVALRFKLMAFENKCITMERKFTKALRYQFKVVFSAWAKKLSISDEDYLRVWFGFKRNLPVNISDEATATAALKGLVSERTRLSLLSFVDDVDYEMQEMENDTIRFGPEMGPLDEEPETEEGSNPIKKKLKDEESRDMPCPNCNGSGTDISTKTGKAIICVKCGGDGVLVK